MRKIVRLMTLLTLTVAMVVMSAASALAASGIDWNDSKITVTGNGIAPANSRNAAQAKMLARRAAITDAYRQLAESVKGVNVDAETTVENMMVTSDVVKTRVSATIQGAKIIKEKSLSDGGYEVVMQVSLFGVSDSVASAVMPRPTQVESFPQPVADVAPSVPSVKVDVTVTTPSAPTTAPSPATAATASNSSAAKAPKGKAIGNFTGLIVDCRGLGLKPVMSPVIKNANGTPIYGYKNLNYDSIVTSGMAGYTYDINKATRAGSNPLVVRAVSLDNHNGNPVLSVADANRVLIENGATGFLDKTNVVFVR